MHDNTRKEATRVRRWIETSWPPVPDMDQRRCQEVTSTAQNYRIRGSIPLCTRAQVWLNHVTWSTRENLDARPASTVVTSWDSTLVCGSSLRNISVLRSRRDSPIFFFVLIVISEENRNNWNVRCLKSLTPRVFRKFPVATLVPRPRSTQWQSRD